MPKGVGMSSSEALLLGIDFSPQMKDGESIVGSNARGTTGIIIKDSDGEDVTAEMHVSGSFSIQGNIVQGQIYNCQSRASYTMYFRAAISMGNFLEQYITIDCT